jgi:hypothetical protein
MQALALVMEERLRPIIEVEAPTVDMRVEYLWNCISFVSGSRSTLALTRDEADSSGWWPLFMKRLRAFAPKVA